MISCCHVTKRSRVQVLENSLLCKNRVRLRTIHQNDGTPSPNPAYAGALVHRAALFNVLLRY
jgi:hypothetical protein